jgi:predicted lipid-binding transport protein (Tim44 family)
VKSQRAREKQAVVIAAALGVLLGVLVVGVVLLALVGAFAGMSETFDSGLPWLMVVGALCCGAYLARQRRS